MVLLSLDVGTDILGSRRAKEVTASLASVKVVHVMLLQANASNARATLTARGVRNASLTILVIL